MPSMPSPKQMVSALYGPDEFEEFVKEWIPALGSRYVLVERHGGTGDHGIDVAGYLSQQKLEGEWHNYQCKRYASALSWSTAVVEMRKMFVFAQAGHFTLPRRYVFVAPRFARTLQQTLAKPTDARSKFLTEWDSATEKFVTDLSAERRQAVKDLAAATDFSIFECADLDEVFELHRTTPHWAERFPHAPLSRGPDMIQPPAQHRADEARYVRHLLDVYRERYPGRVTDLEQVSSVEEADAHLKRQRVAFFAAESLRAFARDSTLPEYFDRLQEDVFDIVVEVAERAYPNGWERHAAVAEAAGSVQVTPTILTPFVQPLTRKGICHHLANGDRLIWCREEET
ncbi:ABC-three component system protein [Nonomuraea maheshkhaliensis]